MMAVLWQGPYGAFAALLALLPLSVSAWVFAQGHRERAAHRATVEALVQAVEIKDAYTRGHSERVGRASVLIAGQLGMSGERLRTLHFAGTLHDVGKLGVATELLRRNGPLTEAERRAVEVHPEYGHDLVRGIDFLGEAHAAILHHHERLDGRGYPHGLVGDRIPEFARIIAVADAFDSMTSTRSYRRGRPVPEAVAELRRCAGSQFDPAMVEALVQAVDRCGWQPVLPPAPAADGAVPDIPLGLPEPGPGRRRGEAGQGAGRLLAAAPDPAVSGASLVRAAALLLLAGALAAVLAHGLTDPRVALAFGVLIAIGEAARVADAGGGRGQAPLGAAAGLAYALLGPLRGLPTGHGVCQVVAVAAPAWPSGRWSVPWCAAAGGCGARSGPGAVRGAAPAAARQL